MAIGSRLFAFLLFASLAFSCVAGVPPCQPKFQAASDSTEKSSKTPRAPTGFTLVRMSNGVKIDGAPYSSNLYEKIADKQRVWLDFFHYASPEEVKKAFDVQVKMATKVVEKGNLLDSEDHVIGERAVLIFSPTDKKGSAMILMTYGKQLRDIQSFSLDVALEFEKQAHTDAQAKAREP